MKRDSLEIINNNLADVSSQQASLRERRLAHICDRALFLSGEFNDGEIFFTSDVFRERYEEVNSDMKNIFINRKDMSHLCERWFKMN